MLRSFPVDYIYPVVPKREKDEESVPVQSFNLNNFDIDVSLEEENHCIHYWKKMIQLKSQSGPVIFHYLGLS